MFFSSQPEYEYFNKETGLWKDFYPKEVDNENNKNNDFIAGYYFDKAVGYNPSGWYKEIAVQTNYLRKKQYK
tara:strand:- start:1628 stop:1843 length:216 start_codon:yes stop_codon:yes gene_type:complete